RDSEELVVRMNGPLIINDSLMLEAAALDGLGLSYTFESQVSQYVADGRLIRVLDEERKRGRMLTSAWVIQVIARE
ncbi:hypothetical protein AB9F44_34930, partial [Rhizobium leguminosarum]